MASQRCQTRSPRKQSVSWCADLGGWLSSGVSLLTWRAAHGTQT